MVDAHCHLYEVERLDDIGELSLIICNGAGIESNEKAWEMAQRYKNVYATAGAHPEEMASFDEKRLEEQIKRPKVVAIGETGLDYYEKTTKEEKEKQKELFKINIKLAKEHKLPLVVHCRNAFDDVFDLVDYDRVQIHCFTGNEEQMRECVRRGWYISVGGIVTFKNDGGLRQVIERAPEDLLLTETDAPWLSPEPFRGEKNRPARVRYILQKLADLRKTDIGKLRNKMEENARRLFQI